MLKPSSVSQKPKEDTMAKNETGLAIVKAEYDKNVQVIAGMDSRTVEDMITVAIMEKTKEVEAQASALRKSLKDLKEGGKSDKRMVKIVEGYFKYVVENTGIIVKRDSVSHCKSLIYIIDVKPSNNKDYNSITYIDSKGNINIHTIHCDYIAHTHIDLRVVTKLSMWKSYIDDKDTKFVDEYVRDMIINRLANINELEGNIKDLNNAIVALQRKRGETSLIAARIRVNNAGVKTADMNVIKKFLGV